MASSRSNDSVPRPSHSGAVAGDEREDAVEQGDRSEPVEHAGHDVDDQHDDHEQRHVAVDGVDREARPAGSREADRAEDPEHHGRGEQHQRDRAGAAGQIPVGARAERAARAGVMWRPGPSWSRSTAAGRSSPADGHPARWQTVPSARTSRLGNLSSESHATARSPRTIAAVLAMLASRHEAAHTLTVRHTLCDRAARGGIDQVMGVAGLGAPAPHGHARGRQPAAVQRDPLPGRDYPGAVVVGHAHPPAPIPLRRQDRRWPDRHRTTPARRTRRRRAPPPRRGRRPAPWRWRPGRGSRRPRAGSCRPGDRPGPSANRGRRPGVAPERARRRRSSSNVRS